MDITAQQEREFYDEMYSRHLALPDHAIYCDLRTVESSLANPAQPIYERRLLYRTLLNVLLAESLSGRSALEYGCGTADWGLAMASQGARVTLLDLSPVAVEFALRRARVSGLAGRVSGVARDASDLSCFASGEFDLIVACAALHHTMKYPHALEELVRVLKPGGKLILAETYGNNPILNAARRLRAFLGREPSEAGEGITISDQELSLLGQFFPHLDLRPINLLGMAKRLFRGHFESEAVRFLLRLFESADTLALSLFPFLRRYCGEVIIIAQR